VEPILPEGRGGGQPSFYQHLSTLTSQLGSNSESERSRSGIGAESPEPSARNLPKNHSSLRVSTLSSLTPSLASMVNQSMQQPAEKDPSTSSMDSDASTAHDDNARLEACGYKSELPRNFSQLDNLLTSVGALYFIGGAQALFGTAVETGGKFVFLKYLLS
jgi:hypothetical protein